MSCGTASTGPCLSEERIACASSEVKQNYERKPPGDVPGGLGLADERSENRVLGLAAATVGGESGEPEEGEGTGGWDHVTGDLEVAVKAAVGEVGGEAEGAG